MNDELKAARWFVELDGGCVAILTDPQYYDMFWESFNIKPVADDPVERMRICTDRSWWLQNQFAFRNRLTDEIASFVFPAGDVFTTSDRVIVRGLYVEK